MTPVDVQTELRDEAQQWKVENGEAPSASSSSSAGSTSSNSSSSKSANVSSTSSSSSANGSSTDDEDDDVDDKEEIPLSPDEQRAAAKETAELAVGVLDFVMTNFVGKRMKLDDQQEAKLVRLATPVVQKHLPTVMRQFSYEERLLAGLATIYAPKFMSPEPVQPGGSPAGGAPEKTPAPATPSIQTDATVDGKRVDAEVLA